MPTPDLQLDRRPDQQQRQDAGGCHLDERLQGGAPSIAPGVYQVAQLR
jgi:hypothetical protein